MWGEYVPRPDRDIPRRFFITFDTYERKWRGHLSIGQHVYMWTSADCGDAYIVDTERCDSLGDAIAALKTEITRLFSSICPLTRLSLQSGSDRAAGAV